MTNSNNGNSVRTLTTLTWVPDFARGLVRDMRVRWALEEAGLDYEVKLVDFDQKKLAPYLSLQPFGQVPVYQEGDLTLFESGAIVHHIASRSAALMPADDAGRSRTLTWMFAALNSVEPAIGGLAEIDLFNAGSAWGRERRPAALERVQARLADLNRVLEGREFLLEQFTAADLLMATVLNNLRHTELVAQYPHVHAYHQRCVGRPAARKALEAQLALYAQAKAPQ